MRDKIQHACAALVSDNETKLWLWMGYYDLFWATAAVPTFDVRLFLTHSLDHGYFETEDFGASLAIFTERLFNA